VKTPVGRSFNKQIKKRLVPRIIITVLFVIVLDGFVFANTLPNSNIPLTLHLRSILEFRAPIKAEELIPPKGRTSKVRNSDLRELNSKIRCLELMWRSA